jgi:murein DD-endopeptidase MepM/ murein hydrolase activator NlpD
LPVKVVVTVVLLLAAAAAAWLVVGRGRAEPGESVPMDSVVAVVDTASCEFVGASLHRKELLGGLLARLGVASEQAAQARAALELTDFDFRRLQPGDSATAVFRESVLVRVAYHVDRATAYEVQFDSVGAVAARTTSPIDTARVVIAGAVHGSLWQSMVDCGADPRLVASFTSILRNDVDFVRGVEAGDSFQLVVDRLALDTAFYAYGDIHCLHYRGERADAWAFYFQRAEASGFYCDSAGRSLGRLLDVPPVTGGRRTSDCGLRMHPILRRRIRHQGLDYEVPYGTPVRAVVGGSVVVRRWSGGYGRTVKVRSRAGLVMRYSHLARYAKGLRRGDTVSAGDVIGYVGSTGLSSGFHLDFGVLRNGRHVDPLAVLPSRHAQVTPAERPGFEQEQQEWRAMIARALVLPVAAGGAAPHG